MARVMHNGTRTLTLQTHQFCVVAFSHEGSHHETAENTFTFRPPTLQKIRFFQENAKGRANLRVVAVEDNHAEARVSNLTLDMAQAMTDISTVSADVEVLQKEVKSVKAELTKLADTVQMLRASGDRLDMHVSRYLENYEKYNEGNRNPYFYLIVIVLVLDLVLEVFLLMQFLRG